MYAVVEQSFAVQVCDATVPDSSSKAWFIKKCFYSGAVRTPVAQYGGALSSKRPNHLLMYSLKEPLQRNPVIETGANQLGEELGARHLRNLS